MKFVSRSSPGRFVNHAPFSAVVSLWILICISTSEGLLQNQYRYIGCFYDTGQTADVAAFLSTNDALSIQRCIVECQTLNTTYAALQSSNTCHCRDNYGVQLGLPDSSCNSDCSGADSEICGGFIGQRNAYSLYTVCPIGTYGAACDKGCHCKRDNPCDRMNGNCPGGCHGNWSGPACNITMVSHQYIGCYRDDSSVSGNKRALGSCILCGGMDLYKNNTPHSCSKSCAERNYSFAGVQYSYQCFCGDSYDRHGRSTVCSMPCSGEKDAICGGVNANSVYSVCPIGNYGKSCTRRCHCYNGGRCIYRNGSCPSSQCEPGWKGVSCNRRDCAKNNGDCSINEICAAINLTYSIASVCRCPNGFQRIDLLGHCTDTDECSLNVCDHDTMICTNTIGSYNCSCRSGFQEHNVTACIDIDECSLKMCDADSTICNNTFGSYDCSCRSGFQSHNTTTCTEIDECAMKVCDPDSMMCTNTIGSYNCSCTRGYQTLNDTVTACMDIDECQEKPCDFYPTTDCQNTPGSYTCICQQWFWSFNGYNCTGEKAITSGVIGFLTGAVLSLAIAFAFSQICSRRKYHDSAMSENKSNISLPISPEAESNVDEPERYVSRPCKPKSDDSSRTKLTSKGNASGKGKSGSSAKVGGKVCRSSKDEAAFNAASDINTYESFNAGASGFDETRIYAELKLYE